MATERLVLKGQLKGHGGWVTALCTSPQAPDMLLSASRDKSIIKWNLSRSSETNQIGYAERRLKGHSHFVQDVAISSDANFALSASWDSTLRLWNLTTGETTERFVDHKKDVLSVAFSPDNTKIVSGSRDGTIGLWNTLGQRKISLVEDGHTDWVSCVRFSPASSDNAIVVSAGWDHAVKVWDLNTCKLKQNLVGHTEYVNTVIVSPDGSLCASGGKDGVAMLWDLVEGVHLYSLEANDIIHSLCFSPIRYWLCAATPSGIKIWDLETKQEVETLKPADLPVPGKKSVPIQCISLAWSGDGQTLFAGYTDNVIRVWQIENYEP